MYVCLCKGITDSQIRDAVDAGAESVREVRNELGVSTQCGRCVSHVREIVKSTLEDIPSSALFYQVA
ncbi:MAG: bacterioferritin-associated ferredoxin [Agarilytica sp.]